MARAPGDLAFVLEAEALKLEPRQGWKRIGVRSPESVADHSWRLALMAMLYADIAGLDGGKAARIALLHDLPEARTGDTLPGARSAKAKHAREARALRSMLDPLPPALRKRYMDLWLDYERGGSPEARLVAELDKLEMVAQGVAYEERGEGRGKGAFDPFWQTARAAVRSPVLLRRLDALHALRPRPPAPRRRKGQGRPTKRKPSSTSGKGSRTSRKRYSRSSRTK